MRIYAIGDIHGRLDLLHLLHEKILEDAEDAEAALYLVYLGDYVDRGPDPEGVLATLCAGPLPGFVAVPLMGNHEEMMLSFLDGTTDGLNWVQFGGSSTLQSYGVRLVPGGDPLERLEEARLRLKETLPSEHEAFLRGLKLTVTVGDYLFVHAGLRPGLSLEAQSPRDLLWIREEFLEWSGDHGRTIVHGHTISPEPEIRSNRIGIDTGAYATGRLTCLVLEGTEIRFLST